MSRVTVPRGMNNKTNMTVKRPERFLASTEAHSGKNPEGPFACFTKKDAIKNLDVRKDERPPVVIERDYPFMKNRMPYGTTTHIYKTGKLSGDYKLDRSNIEQKELPRNKTDHVSYDPPTSTRPQQRVYDLMMTKPRYAKNHQSTVHWIPHDQKDQIQQYEDKLMKRDMYQTEGARSSAKSLPPASQRSRSIRSSGSYQDTNKFGKTLNNRSSVKHNIITGEQNLYAAEMKPGLLDKQVCNKKLGITQLRDLGGPNAINRNPDYVKAVEESPNVFKKQNGIFTHLYNAAHRFGETEVFKC